MPGRAALLAAAIAALVSTSACDLDLANPNSPTEQTVLTTTDGVIALAVGMQGQFANSVLMFIRAPALVTDEWSTRSPALASAQALATGQGIDPSFNTVSEPFTAAYRVVSSANQLLSGAPQVGLASGTQAGVMALARTFKAMSLGFIIQQYEQIPIQPSLEGAPLQPRAVVLDTIINLLETAQAEFSAVPAAQLTEFRNRVQGTGFDLGNTINAMLARYYLIAGRHQQAIEAADRVNLSVLSLIPYPDPVSNPIYNYAFGILYVAGLDSFITEAEPGDQRPAYWLQHDAAPVAANPPATLRPLRRYSNRNDPFPVYLPDEMRLIKAEAYVRIGGAENQARALGLINEVRTRTNASVNEPVAGLPPKTATELNSADALLRQIAYERRYSLYMQGLRWEDLRRLGTVVGRQPKAAWLPIPQSECLNNPARPCG
jgi:hypothetical protein